MTYALATGRRQPFRDATFDSVVHTDVLCCLSPKLAMLRECQRILRPGGHMAFATIYVPDGLPPSERRLAVRAGPFHVAARRPYPELVEQAGFADVRCVDVTAEYAETQRAWLAANDARADEMRALLSAREFATAQSDRRRAAAAIAGGLLRRVLMRGTRAG